MGKNIVEDSRGTIFLDLDGSCVIHNYDPENVADVFIPAALDWIKDRYIEGYRIVITTSRRKEHCKGVGLLFGKEGIQLTGIINGLGTGIRILVNDHQFGAEDKAVAMNPLRDAWDVDKRI
jgi:predicted mannosyl-3-phosphoglycerate phosphatase (HAD superfamily)